MSSRYNRKVNEAIAKQAMVANTLGGVKFSLHKDGYWLFTQDGCEQLTREQCNNESAEQKTVWSWLKHEHPDMAELTWHTPNETAANPFYGQQQKEMGKQAGVSDLVTFYGVGGAFELKRHNPKLYRMSKEQKRFLMLTAKQGKFACCAWGAEAMKFAVMFYLQDKWR